MAIITKPVLTLSPHPTLIGWTRCKVDYEITFDEFDTAADQPYTELVLLIGDDTGVGDGPSAGGDDTLDGWSMTVRASMIVPPATTLKRSRTMERSNAILNEDTAPVPNPDELRASVTLTPHFPVSVGPVESDITAVVLS
jgi:hypothetical protein